MASGATNPILNNPYAEPGRHYATNVAGELDYARPVSGRRLFTPEVQSIPVQQGKQGDIFGFNEVASAQYGTHLVNLLRREVGQWRADRYPNTTRITRELLQFWFLNEERDWTQTLFFAQREAVETAIWLNEVAERSNPGTHILRELDRARGVSADPAHCLPRVAFKMATGTGKTVVMAALIAYHYFNRQEYHGDPRFADNVLVVTPGITIRDRLAVLRVDTQGGIEATDYYHVRHLVPRTWRPLLAGLNSRLVITNFHAFEPRTLQGNKRSPFDGKPGPGGVKREAREDHSQVLGRLLGQFRAGSRLLVLNDEAHHCYQPREDTRKAEGENTQEENVRAAVWFTGLVRLAERFKIRSVYDLSATPYYLTGSGYPPYSLFPWVVTDFGLIEAIESGLVKIPFLPTRDDTQEIKLPVLRNLYEHVRDELPKAGQRTQRQRAKSEGESLAEAPPRIPDTLKLAFKQFYEHYEQEFRNRRHSLAARGSDQLTLEDNPPVFIVVCNNTSVSKEVFKYLAGYEPPADDAAAEPVAVPGAFELFSNFDPVTRQARPHPPALLIDSDALENSGQIDAGFKRVFARELDLFKRDYSRAHGQGAAEDISDAEILREVVNTVGRRNALGAHIRCVVSVSMLTEGWDANTVTHIVGVRAFGSQLLCEQVAGRALRRRSYLLSPYDEKSGALLPDRDARRRKSGVLWKFPPEYAHIIGVPFKLFKGGEAPTTETRPVTVIRALPERSHLELTFPNVDGYRLEYPEGPLSTDFTPLEDYLVDGSRLPTKTILGTAVSGEERELSVESILAMREQEIFYRIAKDLLRDHFPGISRTEGVQLHRFHELRDVVADWYDRKVRVLGKDPKWKKLLYFQDPGPLVAHVARAIKPAGPAGEAIRAILNYYNPAGSTRFVHGQTTRETCPVRFSQVNAVIVDSGWEAKVAKTLDDLADEGHVLAWVKNAFLDLRIPYTDAAGKERHYLPDFLVHCRLAGGPTVNLLVEVTGLNRDKTEKLWTVRHRWLPAVNSLRETRGWPLWDFLELNEETAVADCRNRLVDRLRELALAYPLSGCWAARRDDELKHGLWTEDFEIPPRKVDPARWASSPLDE